ncbi:choline ABC transporter substrate-binding protein [Ectopseudomonas khazarica]|uniref:choline ABC transporter substrate-binding protein n=1 Tax=Ectopseudomonas khazarica TaxID=2502979 RepID=UPI0037C71DE9
MNLRTTLFAASLLAVSLGAQAQTDSASCSAVTLADPGWSDIAVTNGIASLLLDGLGYKAQTRTLAVPIIFAGLQKGQVDVFLGNWMPAGQHDYARYVESGQVDKVVENLGGTEYTLAVPTYTYAAGVKDFSDLKRFAERFDRKIYGIGSGSPANDYIRQMIEGNEFGLGDWKLVESSEQAMLVQVGRAVKRDEFVVFLGWTPHPMNVQFDMQYLKGGEKFFGSTGSVNTLARKGYVAECPNVGRLLSNLTFTQEMENTIMDEVLNRKVASATAISTWIKANPQVLERWLDGVTTRDGADGLAAVKARL